MHNIAGLPDMVVVDIITESKIRSHNSKKNWTSNN